MRDVDILEQGLRAANVPVSEHKISQCLAFLALLQKWNQKHNFTRVPKSQQVQRHILDSLSILSLCQGERILDVGSGAGLPGIPLSIFCPEQKFYLLDSNQKRCIFVKYASQQLGLENVVSVHSLVQDYQPDFQFQTIVSRAFASIDKFVSSCSHLLQKDGKLVAMTGRVDDQPVGEIPSGFQVEACIQLKVPDAAARHAVIVSKSHQEKSV